MTLNQPPPAEHSAPNRSASVSAAESFLKVALSPTLQVLLPAQNLSEILRLGLAQIVLIPDMPRPVVGVCEWRGEVLWLLDLCAQLGGQPLFQQSQRQSEYETLVISAPSQVGHLYLGLVVRQILQVQTRLAFDAARSLTQSPSAQALSHVAGYLLDDGQALPVVDCESVISSLKA